MGGVNLEQLASHPDIGANFRHWEKVSQALEEKRMPPGKLPQPDDAVRRQTVQWIRAEMRAYAKAHDGDPGRVTVRRLTSGEYGYIIQDLTGLPLETGIDSSSDSAGGEGFTNFGDVQFMQDANVERYLKSAKIVAEHAVIGSGPLEFFTHPGKTGFELSAITRVREIYGASGFRTVSGEGGIPFGLDKYGKSFYAAWRFQHRIILGEPNAELKNIAAREGINSRFAQHIWSVLNNPGLGYPSSEVVSRWKQLPPPPADEKTVRAKCEEIQKFLTTWPSWLFARGDVAAGGAGDESPLEFSDALLKAEPAHEFRYNAGVRFGRTQPTATPGPIKFYLHISPVSAKPGSKATVIWRNPTIAFRQPFTGRPGAVAVQPNVAQPAVAGQTARRGFPPAGPKQSLRSVATPETASRLNFGRGPDGTTMGADDFVTMGTVMIEVPKPESAGSLEFQATAELGGDRDQVFRIVLSDREDGSASRGAPTRALLGDMRSSGYKAFRAGVMELAAMLPPNSHKEPTPADKDQVPAPFDNTYNVPEHDEFVVKVKYLRDDSFVYENMLDDATRARVNHAWNDVYASFEYHDNYLRLLASHYKFSLGDKHIGQVDDALVQSMPAEMRQYVAALRVHHARVTAAQAAARPGHVEDCLRFASRAWRKPLSEAEKQSLRSFYDKAITTEGDHAKAIRALIARILVAPAFLYRVEQAAATSPVKTLSGQELAARLSFFIWSSIPDEELLRAASAGELNDAQKLQRQVKRMLADPKARRLSAEFFGQWLGFYHFDQHRGVDTGRFPEFTDDVKKAMYDEAVSFFEYVIRKDRPVQELLFADYAFLNQPLAKHYGVTKPVQSQGGVELVQGVNSFQRGGLLRLGALLTATSAPLRTSPVKRGDWLLRRVLGISVPPPPADAGSIPADDKLFGGLTVHERLEAHKRNPTCANCHVRIDPLGFPLERYDSIGRLRDKYADGKPVYDSGVLADQTKISGIDGLLAYLQTQEKQVLRTLASKLIGYSLGRTVQPSDELLIERMAASGGNASFSKLVGEIAGSKQFRNRLGREDSPAIASVAAKNTGAAGRQ